MTEEIIEKRTDAEAYKDIEDLLDELMGKKLVEDKDRDAYRFCLALFHIGAHKKELFKFMELSGPIEGERLKTFEKYWYNLRYNRYFSRDCGIYIDEPDMTGLTLMVLVAMGYVERAIKKRYGWQKRRRPTGKLKGVDRK